jgi:ECF transporter S component (folate family)
MKRVRTLVFMALFIAMNIVLTRFLSITTQIVRIGFGFLPIAFAGIMFGPLAAGVVAAVADVVGVMLFPAGPFFAGFTLSAFLGGVIYGLFLHKKPTITRTILAVLLIRIFIDLGLNTLWLSMLYGKGWMVLISTRLIASAIMLPIQVILIYTLWNYVGKRIKYLNN